MRILVVAGSRLVGLLLSQQLHQHNLSIEIVDMATATADRGETLILLHVRRWNLDAETQLRYLAERKRTVFLVCRASTCPERYVAMLESGAADAFSDEEPWLTALALQVARHVREHQPVRWRLGARIFDGAEGCLWDGRCRLDLAATEWRLLRRLCTMSAQDPKGRLTTAQLARDLPLQEAGSGSRDSSIRNYITKLRRKLEDDPKHPRVLLRDANGYYLALAHDGLESKHSLQL